MRILFFLLLVSNSVYSLEQQKDSTLETFPKIMYQIRLLSQSLEFSGEDFLDGIVQTLHRVSCYPTESFPVRFVAQCTYTFECEYSFKMCQNFCIENKCICSLSQGYLYRDSLLVSACVSDCVTITECVHPLGYLSYQSFWCQSKQVAHLPSQLCEDFLHFRFLFFEYLHLYMSLKK